MFFSSLGYSQLTAPTNFVAQNWTWNGTLTISFNWQGPTPYGYIFEYSTNNGSSWSVYPKPYGFTTYNNVTISGISGPNNGIPLGKVWSFRVCATDGVSDGPFSGAISVLGDEEPQLPTISAPGISDIILNFQSGSSSETGFLVERGTNSSFGGTTTFYSLGPTNYPAYMFWTNHDAFLPNTTYYYRIAATNSAGQTFWSTAVSMTPNQTPPAATMLQAYTTTTPGNVNVVWISGGGSVGAWLLQRSAGDTSSWSTINTVVDNGSQTYTYSDTGLSAATTYYYQVIATNGAGNSISNFIKRVTMPAPASGTTWYVDANVPATSDWSGTSWANAWPNLASANWSAIGAGNTIWVAQGNYNEVVFIQAGGSSTNNPLTIHAATNAPQSGLATFQQFIVSRPFVSVNGALNDAFSLSTDLRQMTNNIGFRFTSQIIGVANGIYAQAPWGLSILWCEVGPVGLTYPNLREGDQEGVQLNGVTFSGTRLAYCWIHDIMGDAFDVIGATNNLPSLGDCQVDHNIFERIHCNFAAVSPGVDIHDNWGLGFALPQVGHPDGFQIYPSRIRIYNNIIQDVLHGRLIYVECVNPVIQDVAIYNNLFNFNVWSPDMGIDFTTEPENVGAPGPFPWAVMTLTNVVIANNTFANFSGDFIIVNRNAPQVTDLKLKNWRIVNNLFANPPGTGSQIDLINATGALNDFGVGDVTFDWNIVGNGGVNYSSLINNISLLTGFTHNSTALPGFSGPFDFHTQSPTSGADLSSYGLPELNVNLDGSARSGTWPIGAYPSASNTQTIDPSLVMWLRFESPLAGFVDDDSGHHSIAAEVNSAQWPTWTTGPSTNVPNAAFFNRWYDGSTFGAGAYAAVTWTNSITGLTNATISAWAYYLPSANNNVANDQTATIMSCDPNDMGPQPGNWILARNFTPFTEFACRTNTSLTSAQSAIAFPDSTATGDTGGWHHYAVTFSNGRFIGYFDGVPFQTNSLPGVTSLNIGGNPAWLDIGSWPHGYGPGMAGFPNNGWMNGSLADLRIYSRALSAGEVTTIMGGGTTGSGPTRPSAPSMLRILSSP